MQQGLKEPHQDYKTYSRLYFLSRKGAFPEIDNSPVDLQYAINL